LRGKMFSPPDTLLPGSLSHRAIMGLARHSKQLAARTSLGCAFDCGPALGLYFFGNCGTRLVVLM
jgi:hypothetical protein